MSLDRIYNPTTDGKRRQYHHHVTLWNALLSIKSERPFTAHATNVTQRYILRYLVKLNICVPLVVASFAVNVVMRSLCTPLSPSQFNFSFASTLPHERCLMMIIESSYSVDGSYIVSCLPCVYINLSRSRLGSFLLSSA